MYFSEFVNEQKNPTWDALEYEKPTIESIKKELKKDELPKKVLSPLNLKSDTVLDCDVVIIGSGAGGGVAAGVLTDSGLNVIVLEKGEYYSEDDFVQWDELTAFEKVFEQQGLASSTDGGINILAGSCVGGGTVINWSASFRTPKHVRHEWVERFGLKVFAEGGEYDEALDAVCERLNVNINYSHRNNECPGEEGFYTNMNNELMFHGAAGTGASCKPVPRNVKNCYDCGSCCHGCPYGSKQSTSKTFLEDAHKTGRLRLITRAFAQKVIIENNVAKGVIAEVRDQSTNQVYKLEVNSRAVISSCGALHTPGLLLRSGLKHQKIGRHLSLHPVVAVAGLFPDIRTELHRGVSMGTYIDDYMDIDGKGYGVVIETPPSHLPTLGMFLPWSDALTYRVGLSLIRHIGLFIAILRDKSHENNRVVIDKNGAPSYIYNITSNDTEILLEGQDALLKTMCAAGANTLLTLHMGLNWFSEVHDEQKLKEFHLKVKNYGLQPNRAQMFSAHQMSSCRLSSHKSDGPLNPDGETWEVKNLFVADASTFPTSLGINPMITIEAISYMIAKKVAIRLGGNPKSFVEKSKQNYPEGPTRNGNYGKIDVSKLNW